MDDFNSETDSDYTSYWRDWVSLDISLSLCAARACSWQEVRTGFEMKEWSRANDGPRFGVLVDLADVVDNTDTYCETQIGDRRAPPTLHHLDIVGTGSNSNLSAASLQDPRCDCPPYNTHATDIDLGPQYDYTT
jgi:hypothetical protein